jgi:SpoVK/Ycf46/Vps4 family AAA+-type ATPase
MLPAFNALEPDTLVLDMAPSELARATAGLGLIHIEKIFMQAAGIPVSWELVRNAKRDIIASEYAGLLELLEPTINFENVGGMEPLKNWARDEIIGPIKAGQTQDVPGGVLLVGPPGTGKTFFVRALAAEVGFQCVAYHQENIMSKWQGESERNMLRALGVVRSLAPVLLFMDELDQSDTANRGQASGSPSAKNLFNQILQFLSDPTIKGKVIFIGASNRPDLLDPALMRFGRIDAIVPVMLPDEIERRAVLEATVRSQDYLAYPEAIEYLTEKTAGYSCADLAAVVTKARKLTQKRNRNAAVAEAMITLDDAKEAFATIRPATLKQAPYFEALALDACNDTSLLPEAYRSRLDDRKALTKQIQEAEGDAFPTRRRL